MAVLKKWISRIPGFGWMALACLLMAAFWLQQHDARVRQQAQLQQTRRQASAEVHALQKQAQQAVKQANVENARAVQQLEARRRGLEQQNRKLAAQLTEMRKQAQLQADEVATLPITKVVTRVATQLGLTAEDVVPKAPLLRGAKAGNKLRITSDELPERAGTSADIAKGATSVPAVQNKLRITNDELPERAGTSADIAKGAISAPAVQNKLRITSDELPKGAEQAADIAKGAISAPAGKRPTVGNAPTVATKVPVLDLTGSGARKVEGALVELKSCRAESAIESRQITNCQARAQADEAAITRLNGSVASLNQALAAKDKIIQRQANEYQSELRAARGSFWGRLAHLTEHVAVGVAVGVVIGVVAR